ncbi:putative trafficking protein particle complex subunit 2 [Cryptosporidium serpentis]
MTTPVSNNGGSLIFTIVGQGDSPIYEVDLTTNSSKLSIQPHIDQLLIHTSLDAVDDNLWINPALFLRTIERLGDTQISALVTPGHAKFLLLHKGRSNENVKLFFNEARDLYVKAILNPFQDANQPILTPSFDVKIRQAARRFLT